jgi:hypothetical protein
LKYSKTDIKITSVDFIFQLILGLCIKPSNRQKI